MAQKPYVDKNGLTYMFTVIKQYVTGLLANKVDKDGSKVLSDNNYTTAEKEKLAGIEVSAQSNKLETVKVNGVAAEITDKAVNISVPTKVSQIQNDSGFQTASNVSTAIAGKADTTALEAHTSNTDIHVTTEDKTKWNAKQDTLTAGSNIRIEGNIISATGEILNSVAWDNITGEISNNTALQTALNAKADEADLTAHTGNAGIHVTSTDKQTWNAKLDASAITDMATKTELATKANAADVYTKTDIDGKGFQNASQVESAITAKGYQTEEQVQTAINQATSLSGKEYKKVESLPQTGETKYIYLVAVADPEEMENYDEYIWITEDNKYEHIGTTQMDLSGYLLASDLVPITNEEIQDLWDAAGL